MTALGIEGGYLGVVAGYRAIVDGTGICNAGYDSVDGNCSR